MKKSNLLFLWLSMMFLIPSCIDVNGGEDPENEEEEIVEEEENPSSNWKFLAEINAANAGWGFYSDQNIEVDKEGRIYVMYQPQNSSEGGGQGYAAVITDSAKYTVEKFAPMVFGTFNLIETEIYNNIPYVCYYLYKDGFPELDVKKRVDGTWTGIGGEIVQDYCDDEFDFAIGGSGDLFVAYGETEKQFDAVGRLTVKKFSNGAWQTLGSPLFSDSLCAYLLLAVGSNNVPYVFYREVSSTDKKTKKAVVQYFDGAKWVKCGNHISESDDINSMSITVLDNKPYVAYSEGSNKKSYVKYWNGTAWKDAGDALPYCIHTVLRTYNGELYAGYRNTDNSNNINFQKLKNSRWEAIEVEGILSQVSTTNEYIDFRVNEKGIYLLDANSSKVMYYPF